MIMMLPSSMHFERDFTKKNLINVRDISNKQGSIGLFCSRVVFPLLFFKGIFLNFQQLFFSKEKFNVMFEK
jgi:hypothetical protein